MRYANAGHARDLDTITPIEQASQDFWSWWSGKEAEHEALRASAAEPPPLDSPIELTQLIVSEDIEWETV